MTLRTSTHNDTEKSKTRYIDSKGTLLTLRPAPVETIFPHHLVDKRFLGSDGFIDLDKMFLEIAGAFRHEVDANRSFHQQHLSNSSPHEMSDKVDDVPREQTKVYDYSDPQILKKVFNRRPKEILTPDQIANLTSVTVGNRPSTIDQSQQKMAWIDDYRNVRCNVPWIPISPLPYHHKNPFISGEDRLQTPKPTFWLKSPMYTRQLSPYHFYQTPPDTVQQQTPVSILQRLEDAAARQQQNSCDIYHSARQNDHACLRDTSICYTPSSPVLDQQCFQSVSDMESSNAYNWLFTEQSTPLASKDLTKLVNDHVQQMFSTPSYPKIDSGDDDVNDHSCTIACEQSPLSQKQKRSQDVIRSSSDELCSLTNTTDNEFSNMSEMWHKISNTKVSEENDEQSIENCKEVYDLIQFRTQEVDAIPSQNILQCLKSRHLSQRHEMLKPVSSTSSEDQSSIKSVLQNMILEQLKTMRSQQNFGEENPSSEKSIGNQRLSVSSLFRNHDNILAENYDYHDSPLDRWFSRDTYSSDLPQMPIPVLDQSVVNAADLEQCDQK
ncbi:unnamed protein product [Didymodactylos carnosus]|uniref:Uncharacterized protein n=1 Tax=Didymodactylos carnosus TaxID=1234261 RepID=A0A814HJG7_9BILA|nr:unnamed protein product [Didymodactylos carnosus]CAF1011717.1 unnamed protein product [Didymodactylos carnosus]CAF3780700.1 unnamed protein product [Didymodactylos carnosus]CAF3782298.1 unnamed protein product [Didymodactylos carnosus]